MTSKTPWRSGFDRLERAAGAPLGRFVQTRSFGKTATLCPRVPRPSGARPKRVPASHPAENRRSKPRRNDYVPVSGGQC